MLLTIDPAEAAARLGIPEARVRKIVRQECADAVPDALRLVPGGRIDGDGRSYVLVIIRAIFDAITTARHLTPDRAA